VFRVLDECRSAAKLSRRKAFEIKVEAVIGRRISKVRVKACPSEAGSMYVVRSTNSRRLKPRPAIQATRGQARYAIIRNWYLLAKLWMQIGFYQYQAGPRYVPNQALQKVLAS